LAAIAAFARSVHSTLAKSPLTLAPLERLDPAGGGRGLAVLLGAEGLVLVVDREIA
jgi:hypothetical protein